MTGAFVTPFHFLFLSCLLASLLTVVSTAIHLFVPLVLIEVLELRMHLCACESMLNWNGVHFFNTSQLLNYQVYTHVPCINSVILND